MDSECCLSIHEILYRVTPLQEETEAEATLKSEWLRFESSPVRVYFVTLLSPECENGTISNTCLVGGGENETRVGSPGEVWGDVDEEMTLFLSGSLASPGFSMLQSKRSLETGSLISPHGHVRALSLNPGLLKCSHPLGFPLGPQPPRRLGLCHDDL